MDGAGRRGKPFEVRHMPGFTTLSAFCLLWLYAPLAIMIVYAFNSEASVTQLHGFSFRWFVQAAGNRFVQDATLLSLKIACVATLVATAAATMAALATTRTGPFKGASLAYALINQPLMIPEIVTAVGTLVFFGLIKKLTGVHGIGYLMLAHTVFCIPFAYMPIRARLEDMDLLYEHAAADLYARPWQCFRRVTFPLLLPGVLAGAMLSFVISFDDVIINLLVSGAGETTLPIYLIGQLRRGLNPEVNAIATVLLGATFVVAVLYFLLTSKRRGR